MEKKQCECFEKIVEEVVCRLSAQRVLSDEQIRSAVEDGISQAIINLQKSMRDTDEAKPKCSAD